MKIIPYTEISARIMTLIDSAEKELFIVSPYVNIENWDKMKRFLVGAIERNVKIWFYVRKNTDPVQNLHFLYEIGISPIFIDNLHAKLYVNDQYGIVTSQNLIYYSDINSIDIGYQTEGSKERAELIDFIDKAVLRTNIQKINNSNYIKAYPIRNEQEFLDMLYKRFRNKYPNGNLNKTKSILYLNNFSRFFSVVAIGFCYYELRVQNNASSELIRKIIEAFERLQFKIEKNYDKFIFYLGQEIIYTDVIYTFEKATDDVLQILQIHEQNEHFFLENVHKKLQNKYTNIEIENHDTCLSLTKLFPFIENSEIHFSCYMLVIDRYMKDENEELIQKIIKLFEDHKFKLDINYKKFYFKLEQKIELIERVNLFEKITDELLVISQSHRETEQLFIEKIHQRFKNKYPDVEFNKNYTSFFLRNLFSVLGSVSIGFYSCKLNVADNICSQLVEKIIKLFEANRFKVTINNRSRNNYYTHIFELEQNIDVIDDRVNFFEKITNELLVIQRKYKKNELLFLEQLRQRIINKYSAIKFLEENHRKGKCLNLSFVKFIDYVCIGFSFYELIIKKNTPSELVLQIIKVFEDQRFKTSIDERKNYSFFSFYFQQKTELIEQINIFEKIADEIFKIAL